jgi:hypothetical protein
MASSVLLDAEAYQINSLAITYRVALERRDFVCISRPEQRKDAENLRRKESKFLDVVANAGENQH